MRNDFGTRPYKSRFPYKAGTKKAGSKKQGYIDEKDESIGMRLGKGKATKEDLKKQKLKETCLTVNGVEDLKTGKKLKEIKWVGKVYF